MSLSRHSLSEDELRSLAVGNAGRTGIRTLTAARRSRNLLMLAALARLAVERNHRDAYDVATALRRLAAIERVAPDAVATVVHHPPLAAWTFRTVRSLDTGRGNEVRLTRVATAAGAAAVLAGPRLSGKWELPLGSPVERGGQWQVTLPGLGRAVLDSPAPLRLLVTPSGATLVGDGTTVPISRNTDGGWQGLQRLRVTHRDRELRVLLDTMAATGHDKDPEFAEDEPYSPAAASAWTRLLADTWQLLVDHHPTVAEEVAALVTVLMPLIPPAQGHVSATPNDAFGAVALTMPSDPASFALTLAHEVQHVKLTAISDLFPLVEDDATRTFYAPWRTDPRPAFGLLHGVYAHIGVVGFWQRQMAHLTGAAAWSAEVEFDRWRIAAREAGHTLRTSARLTPAGRVFVDGMCDQLTRMSVVPVSAAAHALAEQQLRAHLRTWNATNMRS